MALAVQLVCCGARPEPVVEMYVRSRAKDLSIEFPEISACRLALERSIEAGWQVRMALVTPAGTVFVREAPNAPRLDDCATAVDRCVRAARRLLAARNEESAVAASEAA